jgi:hypothetical protein
VTQLRQDRTEAARASLERAIAIAGPDSPLPQIGEARRIQTEIGADQAPATQE